MAGDPPIIINGRRSITIEFPESNFAPDTAPNGKKFKNTTKHLKRIEITGDGAQQYVQDFHGKDVVIRIDYS